MWWQRIVIKLTSNTPKNAYRSAKQEAQWCDEEVPKKSCWQQSVTQVQIWRKCLPIPVSSQWCPVIRSCYQKPYIVLQSVEPRSKVLVSSLHPPSLSLHPVSQSVERRSKDDRQSTVTQQSPCHVRLDIFQTQLIFCCLLDELRSEAKEKPMVVTK